jgi:ring-1,2-phenylacetyl-CoA epoxidase subunit PaaB
MIIKSLDPRISRAGLDDQTGIGALEPMDQWQTYEVFQQKKRGTHHSHVGSLHAPNQYARRGQCVNLWVVKTSDVFATSYEDEDIFATTPEKTYREAEVYKVMDRIQAFKEKQEKS